MLPAIARVSTSGGIAGVGVVSVASAWLWPANRMARAGVADLCLSYGDSMPALVGPGTWINGVYVVDAAAGSIPLNDLVTHDDLVDGDRGIGR